MSGTEAEAAAQATSSARAKSKPRKPRPKLTREKKLRKEEARNADKAFTEKIIDLVGDSGRPVYYLSMESLGSQRLGEKS